MRTTGRNTAAKLQATTRQPAKQSPSANQKALQKITEGRADAKESK
jgi:hypothetical protein